MESNVTQQFFPDKRVHEGMTYKQYLEMTKVESANTNIDILTIEQKERSEIIKLNIHRMTRIDKSYEPGIDIRDEIEKIADHQLWMVITENWCGDSAQNLFLQHSVFNRYHSETEMLRYIKRLESRDLS